MCLAHRAGVLDGQEAHNRKSAPENPRWNHSSAFFFCFYIIFRFQGQYVSRFQVVVSSRLDLVRCFTPSINQVKAWLCMAMMVVGIPLTLQIENHLLLS